MKNKTIKGSVWLVKDAGGAFINNIDTDMIFHNKHLAITDIKEMGKHTFGNLKGWEDFPKKAKPGDIVIVGENFGSGSSRQQAVDCFSSLGISAIIAKSFGAIYKRNAINSAMPIIECKELDKISGKDGEDMEINLEKGEIKDSGGKLIAKTNPMTGVQMDIYLSGGLFNYAKNLK
jgi:3-isopropylmalate/(R)-2-methylmalate dehydratase small subunit